MKSIAVYCGSSNKIDDEYKKEAIKVGMLFQGGALFDSLKIWQNVSFYNIQKGKNKKFCYNDSVLNLEKVGLDEDVASLYPSELSGGMQKRVALARAISIKPDIISVSYTHLRAHETPEHLLFRRVG